MLNLINLIESNVCNVNNALHSVSDVSSGDTYDLEPLHYHGQTINVQLVYRMELSDIALWGADVARPRLYMRITVNGHTSHPIAYGLDFDSKAPRFLTRVLRITQ